MEEELPKILCVDDEPHVLEGLQRSLFEHYDVTTATSGAQGLELLAQDAFEVIVSDMRMPEMSGAQFLKAARASYPNVTRILLTGHADLESAMSAINEAHIFRFLLKPCDTEVLLAHLDEAVHLYRLRNAEKDLLENTLKGSVRVLADILNIAAPEAFRSTFFIRRLAAHIVQEKKLEGRWEYDIAAMLSQLGAVALPDELLKRAFNSVALDEAEEKLISSIPKHGAQLLEHIPRLKRVALMIESQGAHDADIACLPARVRTGARLLRLCTWIETTKLHQKLSIHEAIRLAGEQFQSEEDQFLLSGLSNYKALQETKTIHEVRVADLKIDMVLEEDVQSASGTVVLPKGTELTGFVIDRLINFSRGAGIKEPIKVFC